LATYHANCDAVVDTFVPLSTILHVDGMLPKLDVVTQVDTGIQAIPTGVSTSPFKRQGLVEGEAKGFRSPKPQISFKEHHELMESPRPSGLRQISGKSTPRSTKLQAKIASTSDVPPLYESKPKNIQKQSSPIKTIAAPPKLVLCAPPAGGKGTQCDLLVRQFGMVHLSTGDMLRAAIKAGTDVGLQAKAFMDAGNLVPDELIIHAVLDRLKQPDCVERGWLLDGFPRSAGQAQAMLDGGISPSLVVVLNVPDDEVVSRIAGRRLDPATGKSYHVEFNPPPESVEVVQRSDDTEETIRVRLATYHEHCGAVVDSFAAICRRLTVDGSLPKEDIASQIVQAMTSPGKNTKPSNPRQHHRDKSSMKHPLRLVICGPPAGGKGTQCERLVEKYGVVHLSTGDMLRAAIQVNSNTGLRAKQFMDAGTLVPDDLIVHVILERLQAPDCAQKGWLLDGFPRTPVQAKAMVDAGIVPDLVLVLHVPDDEVVARISGRRVDLTTGKTYHVTFNPPPPGVDVVQRSDDNEETIRVRLATYHANCDAVVDTFVPLSTILHVDGMLPKPDVVKSVDTAIEVVQTIARKGGGYAEEELSLSESDHLRLAKKAVLRHAAVASQTHQPPTVAVLGPPGSGKSYHCHWLHEHLGVVHFSVGEMLRRSIDAETRVGVKAKVYVEVGDVVPDSLIVGTTVEILRARECRTNGWALDGFPRTSGQAKALVEHDIVPDIVVVLDVVDDNEVVHRISGRRFDPVTDHTYHVTFDPPPPGVDVKLRTDDTEGAVRLSLAQYRAHCVDIEAVLAAHTKVVHVDGCLSKAQVHAHLSRLFPSLKAKGKHPTQPSGLRPPRGFHHGHHPTSLMKAASSLKPLKLPPTVLAAYSPPKTNRPKSTHNDDDDKAKADTSAATDDDIQAALAELHEIQVENVRLKQLFLDTSKHPSKEGMSKPRQGNRGGGDREYDVVLEQLASEKKSLQRVTKRQKESIDANEWETLLQKTMTELDIMRKKIQACKKSHAVVSDDEEAKWKAVQCRHEQLKTTWRQLNQPDSVTATEKANAKLKLLKREKTLQRTDEGYYLQKAIHVQATTTHEVHRMQKQTARLQEAIAMAQSQLDTCAAECSELQRQINTKQGAFLPKLPNAKAVHPPVPTRVQSHASLPPIAVKKPHTGCDVPKKRMAVPPLIHTSRDKY
ncbi:hypothetical protein DYB25_007518, partial [Aphanomyces astaci]